MGSQYSHEGWGFPMIPDDPAQRGMEISVLMGLFPHRRVKLWVIRPDRS
jgi:hypothetical protein